MSARARPWERGPSLLLAILAPSVLKIKLPGFGIVAWWETSYQESRKPWVLALTHHKNQINIPWKTGMPIILENYQENI